MYLEGRVLNKGKQSSQIGLKVPIWKCAGKVCEFETLFQRCGIRASKSHLSGSVGTSFSHYKIINFNIVFYCPKFIFPYWHLYSCLFYPLAMCNRHNWPRTTKFRSALHCVLPYWIYIFYPISVFYLGRGRLRINRRDSHTESKGIPSDPLLGRWTNKFLTRYMQSIFDLWYQWLSDVPRHELKLDVYIALIAKFA